MRKRMELCGLAVLALIVFIGGGIPSAMAADASTGSALYQQRCSACHGPDGKAETPAAKALVPKPADHTDGAHMNPLSADYLFTVIKKGGAAVKKSPLMPPQADLSDDQIKDLVAYLRSLADPPYKGK